MNILEITDATEGQNTYYCITHEITVKIPIPKSHGTFNWINELQKNCERRKKRPRIVADANLSPTVRMIKMK